jgi:DNA-binding NtrC family response regulator
MQNRNLIEHERLRLLKTPDSKGAHAETPSTSRLEALKVLTLALLNEIEALGQAATHGLQRSINLSDEVRRFETDLIRGALMQTGGRQRRAARLLGMKVPTLHAKMKRYQINPDEFLRASPEMLLRKEEMHVR